jgi:hypothetical protein
LDGPVLLCLWLPPPGVFHSHHYSLKIAFPLLLLKTSRIYHWWWRSFLALQEALLSMCFSIP